jgi:branched-chain amino acid transport system substrate-binding protein
MEVNMLRKIFAAFVVAAAVGLIPAAQAATPIKIGIVGPMAFVQGESMWAGAEMARDEINKAGGVKVGNQTRPVEIVKVDSNELQSVTDATNAMERAITRDKVDFVVGGFRTEAVLAMQDVAMDYKKIFLGVGASSDELGLRVEKDYNRYKYWFRVAPTKSSDLGKTLFSMLATIAGQIRTELGKPEPKVAIVAEKAQWTGGIVAAAQATLPKMKMQVVGLWQPSPIATDVTAELSAIRRADADIIFTALSGPVGIVIGRQMGELQIPAIQFGINVEAQKDTYWQATGGKANYVATLNTYAEGVANTSKTVAFVDGYKKRFGGMPVATSQSYDAIHLLKDTIEKNGTLDAAKLVAALEKTDYVDSAARLVFDKHHDVTFGPGYALGVGVQWQDGHQVGFWPNNWNGVTYGGVKPFKIPPYMMAKKTAKAD